MKSTAMRHLQKRNFTDSSCTMSSSTRLKTILLMLCALTLGAGNDKAQAAMTAAQLRCEYRTAPLGIDVLRPRLSWIVQSPRRAEGQTAYQILVAGSAETLRANRGDLWDSGRVASSQTAHVVYAGRAPGSGQECWWKVRTWDRDGKPSNYSAPSRWTMGLLRPTDWKARWIGLEKLPPSAANTNGADAFKGLSWVWSQAGAQNQAPAGTRHFRRTFQLPARPIKAARFLITADDQWTLWVNGQAAGKSDSQLDAWRRPATVDVAGALRDGQNTLAVAAQNSGPSPAGLAGKLTIEFQSGDPLVMPIDAAWKTLPDAPEGWQSAAFNDAAWPAATVVAQLGDAPWNWPGQNNTQYVPPATFLRRAFNINKPVRRATAYATALGLYEMRLNGARVGQDVFAPGWSDYRKRTYYQTYDVTPMLRRGANALGLIVGDGWAVGHVGNGGRNRYGLTRPRVAAQIVLTFEDGTQQTLVTDSAWRASLGPIVEQDLLDGETYDARRETPRWDTANFNDARWQAVDVHGADSWPAKIEAYPGVPVRRVMELRPRSVTQPTPGAYVFDLGQNMVGWARLAVAGARGTRIRLRFAEMLNPDGTIYTTNLRGARCIDTYVCKGGGRELWEPRFTFHGFRYVEVTGYPGVPPRDAVTGIVAHSDTPKTGTFVSSSALVNQLQSNIEWGQRGNFLEVPTDCPQRDERLGWMGDIQVFIRTAAHNMDVSAFITKWMIDVEDAQRGGAFADVAPDVCCGAGTPAWADAGVIVPHAMYQIYGDRRIIEKHYDAMARYIEFIRAANPNFLWEKQRGSDYGDWLNMGADTPRDVIGTAYFAHSTALLAQMARAIGRNDDAQKYEALFANIRAAFNAAYVGADGRIKGDTQTCYLLALNMNLLNEEKRAFVIRHLVDEIAIRNCHLSTGFVGVSYLHPVLTRFGRDDVAYRLLLNDTFPSWGYSIRQGATTIWERWDGWTREKGFQDPGMNSFNHYALGSVGEWLYDTVAGISPAEAGYGRILIRPRIGGGLTSARGAYDSIRGRIVSDWKMQGGALQLNVTIPANTTATVHVPVRGARPVTESGQRADRAAGVTFLRMENGAAVYEVGSGTYRFAS